MAKRRTVLVLWGLVLAALILVLAPHVREQLRMEKCSWNLAAIARASRIWANAHDGYLPSDFLCMSNELGTPRILICPEDNSREPAESWAAFTSANSSYAIAFPGRRTNEFLSMLPWTAFAHCRAHRGPPSPFPLRVTALAAMVALALWGWRSWHQYQASLRDPVADGFVAKDLMPRLDQVRQDYLAARGPAHPLWYRKTLLSASRQVIRALGFFRERTSQDHPETQSR